jgi:hypothetical protein
MKILEKHVLSYSERKMTYYDPNHRDADWSGYVSISSRKHVHGQKHGEEDEWKPSKRIDIAPKSKDSLDLIGGPVPKDDPSTLCPCNWQSEAQAASAKTTVDQLTETGRSQIRCKNKRHVGWGNSLASLSGEDPYYYLLNNEDAPFVRRQKFLPLSDDPNLNLVGYRQVAETSLLANLGKDLYASTPSLVGKQRTTSFTSY